MGWEQGQHIYADPLGFMMRRTFIVVARECIISLRDIHVHGFQLMMGRIWSVSDTAAVNFLIVVKFIIAVLAKLRIQSPA